MDILYIEREGERQREKRDTERHRGIQISTARHRDREIQRETKRAEWFMSYFRVVGRSFRYAFKGIYKEYKGI